MTIIRVHTAFFIENHQLFYQASLDVQSHKMTLRIFNHKGIQKSRRILNFPAFVTNIFAADKYVIGLDEKQIKICVFDIIKYTQKFVYGEIPLQQRQPQEKDRNRKRFTHFYYNHQANIIFGLLDNKQIYYLSIKRFDSLNSLIHQKSIPNQSRLSKGISQFNLQIKRLYISVQSIDKFELRKIRRQKVEQAQEKQFVAKSQSQIRQEQHLKQEKQIQMQDVYELCLLIKQKNILRILQIDWSRDQIVKSRDIQNIFDFCFQYGWDMIIEHSNKEIEKKILKNQNNHSVCNIKITSKGDYQSNPFSFSKHHCIFSSQQSLFVVDPQVGIIVGVHNRQFRQITQCYSIPKNIGEKDTLMIVQRPDKYFIRFVFQKFQHINGQFVYYSLLIPSHKIQTNDKQQQYVKKNIQQVFTIEGLIHSHFKEIVQKILERNINNSINSSQNIVMKKEESQNQIQKNQPKINSKQVATKFLQTFVMIERKLINQLISHLLRYGTKKLFGKIKYKKNHQTNDNYMKSSQKIQGSPRKNNQNIQQSFKITSKKDNQATKQKLKQNYVNKVQNEFYCNFSIWHDHFCSMIQTQINRLKSIFLSGTSFNHLKTNKNQSLDQQSLLQSSLQNLQFLYEDIIKIKQKLALISNIYNRLLNQICDQEVAYNPQLNFNEHQISPNQYNSSLKFHSFFHQNEQKQNNKNLDSQFKHWKKQLKQILSYSRSLFLIYDIIHVFKCQKDQNKYYQSKKLFEQVVRNLFNNKFPLKRQENIQNFLKQKNLSSDIQMLNYKQSMKQCHYDKFQIPILMLHQHFEKIRALSNGQDEISFESIFEYFLLNIDQFEETSYFYFALYKQFILMQQNKMESSEIAQKQKINTTPEILNIKQHLIKQLDSRIFPYTSKKLFNVLALIEEVHLTKRSDRTEEELSKEKRKIQHICQLVIALKIDQFNKFMIQICVQYDLSSSALKLLQGITFNPYAQNFGQNQNQITRKYISKCFVDQQMYILKAIMSFCYSYNQKIAINQKNIHSSRQLLMYEIKRIEDIYKRLKNQENKMQKYQRYNKKISGFQNKNKLTSHKHSSKNQNEHQNQKENIKMTESKTLQENKNVERQQIKHPESQIKIKKFFENDESDEDELISQSRQMKNYLISQFISMLIIMYRKSQVRDESQGIEKSVSDVNILFLIKQLKQEYFTSSQDKQIIDKLMKEHKL